MANVMLKGGSIFFFVQNTCNSIIIDAFPAPFTSKQKEERGLSLHKARDMALAFKATFSRYKPHVSMLLSQFCYAIVYFFTEAAFSQGLNPHTYVAYRYCLAGWLMFPFAYFIERKSRPKLTLPLLLELFLLSLIGTLTLNMYFASLKYTSPTFVASLLNTVPSWTFVLAIILRMEVVDVKNPRGIGKILGTLISLAGVTTITLYKGPAVQSLWSAPIHIKRLSVHENWGKGSILTVASCIMWALWYIMQASTLKKYPVQVSLASWMNCIGGAQTAVFAVFLQHKPSAWSIKMLNILGGVLVIIGLHLLLWGKERDQSYIKSQEQSSSHCDAIEVANKEEVASAEKEES
ncbi:hypothetical protein CRYUN_Cryun23aG0076700 [Craigia yunnanensis]